MPFSYAIFSSRFSPFVGGVESYTESLSHELIAQGNAVTVVTQRLDDSPEFELREDGITVLRLPAHSFLEGRAPVSKHSRRHKELMGALDGLSIDRVLVNTRLYRHSIDGLRYASKRNLPVVCLDHGSAYLTLGNSALDGALNAYEHALTRSAMRFKPHFAGVSQKSVEWLKTFGIETTTVIPNAIDASEFRELSSGRDFRAELGIGESDYIVAFVGRLTPEKGPEQLVAAVQLLEGSEVLAGGKVHAVLAGQGFLEEGLKKGAPINAHFLGALEKPDVSALLQISDLFCLPTRSEGFCTALLEASACGLPAAITDVGGARELIPSLDCGTIMPSMAVDEVLRSLRDLISQGKSALRAKGATARTVVEQNYTWHNTVEALEAAFACYA